MAHHPQQYVRDTVIRECNAPGFLAYWLIKTRRFCRHGSDAREVLNETISRLLAGRRKWPIEVPWEPFFHQTLRSVSCDFKPGSNHVPLEALDWIGQNMLGHPTIILGAPDDAADVAHLYQRFEALFEDDPVLLDYARLKFFKVTRQDVMAKLALTDRQCNALDKRYTRKLLTASRAARDEDRT